jgi:hypothetical protein
MREITREEAEFVAGASITQILSGLGQFNYAIGSNYIYASVVAGTTTNATITTILEGTVNFGGANGSSG